MWRETGSNSSQAEEPRLVIRNILEDITTSNIEGTLIKQNPDLCLKAGDINTKFNYETKKHSLNLVVEVNAQTRKLLLQKKLKLDEWSLRLRIT